MPCALMGCAPSGLQDFMLIEESSEFCIQSDQHRSFVEAWTAWHLPFMKLTPAQQHYRACLRGGIASLAADGMRATYASRIVTRNLDTENVLFYNVGAAPFREVAKQSLRFERSDAVPPPRRALAFEPLHYVRYQAEKRSTPFEYVEGEKLAHCLPLALAAFKEIRELPRLWWLFKRAIEKTANAAWPPSDPFVVQIHISAPAHNRLNLADVVKPVMDGFISALHHYEGSQLDVVAGRIADLLDAPIPEVRSLLLEDRSALLGPRAVPHARGEGLQWSPADHLLIAGEVLRDVSPDDQLVQVRGSLFKAAK